MGWLDRLRPSRAPRSRRSPAAEPADTLFDEEFQRKLETLAMVARRVFSGAMRAERRTKRIGSGVEFADHRDYVPGDDFRRLDWNAYQRFDRLLLRLFQEEEDLSIYFVLDSSASMGFGNGQKLRYAKQLCAALAYVGLANLDRVAIVTANDELSGRMRSTRGKARIFRVFRFLDAVQPEGGTSLEGALRTFVAQHKRRGMVVLLSDLYDHAGFERGINVLRHNKFEPLVIHLIDPADRTPTLAGDLLLYDCETAQSREVTVTARVLERYARAFDDYQQRIERFCVSKQVSYVAADMQIAFDELILRVFRRGGFLR